MTRSKRHVVPEELRNVVVDGNASRRGRKRRSRLPETMTRAEGGPGCLLIGPYPDGDVSADHECLVEEENSARPSSLSVESGGR